MHGFVLEWCESVRVCEVSVFLHVSSVDKVSGARLWDLHPGSAIY